MELYESIIKDLQAPFPNGTVINKGKRYYIPSQVYMHRLESVAKDNWHWRITSTPQIDIINKVVTVIGELQVCNAIRQGIGVAPIGNESGSQQIKTAVLTAETDAFRDCCDKFQMGWKDLASFREWGNNPALHISGSIAVENNIVNEDIDGPTHSFPATFPTSSPTRSCIKCQKTLEGEDIILLTFNNIRNDYCREHIPKQFIKNL
jgi:hypothetical protein